MRRTLAEWGYGGPAFESDTLSPRGAARNAVMDREGCLLRSEPDEPVFVLCARDPHALVALDIWLHERRAQLREMESALQRAADGTEPAKLHDMLLCVEALRRKIHEAAQVAQAFLAWQSRQ